MADTTALKNRIRAAIKANDNQEITGPVLQQALLDMIDELNGAEGAENTLQQMINEKLDKKLGNNLVDPEKLIVGKYIRLDGQIVNADSNKYKVSDYISVNEQNIISNSVNHANIGAYAVYNANKEIIRVIKNTTQYSYQSGDIFIRIGFYTESHCYANYGDTLVEEEYIDYKPLADCEKEISLLNSRVTSCENELSYLDERTEEINEQLYVEKTQLVKNTAFSIVGVIQQGVYKDTSVSAGYADYRVTDFIELPENTKKISFADCIGLNGYNSVALYSTQEESSYLGGYLGTPGTGELTIQGNLANARYVRFTSKYTSSGTVTSNATILFEKSAIEDIDENIESINDSIEEIEENTKDSNLFTNNTLSAGLHKIICVGDSVTKGLVADYPYSGTFEGCSYPSFLSKIANIACDNGGVTGITVSNWYKNEFSKYNFTQYSVCIIEFGYNDDIATNTLSTDVEPYDDYHDYADTDVGNFCKLIENIMEINSNIVIFICMPARYDPTVWKGATISAIANRYSIPVFNLHDSSYIDLNALEYHGLLNSGDSVDYTHFNRVGYLMQAKLVAKLLGKQLITTSVLNKAMRAYFK